MDHGQFDIIDMQGNQMKLFHDFLYFVIVQITKWWLTVLMANRWGGDHKSMGYCKKDVTPLLMEWSYVFLALTHRKSSTKWSLTFNQLSVHHLVNHRLHVMTPSDGTNKSPQAHGNRIRCSQIISLIQCWLHSTTAHMMRNCHDKTCRIWRKVNGICAVCLVTHQYTVVHVSWWFHQIETFFALLALPEGNPPVIGGFPS